MKHLAIFLLLLVPVLASCSGDKDGQGGRQARAVHVMTVQPQDVPRVLGAVGNVKASASVGLTPRVTGEIEKVHFTEGQDVKEGDVLLTIDTRPFEATLREKKGQLAKSEAQLHKATNDAGRYGKLVGKPLCEPRGLRTDRPPRPRPARHRAGRQGRGGKRPPSTFPTVPCARPSAVVWAVSRWTRAIWCAAPIPPPSSASTPFRPSM